MVEHFLLFMRILSVETHAGRRDRRSGLCVLIVLCARRCKGVSVAFRSEVVNLIAPKGPQQHSPGRASAASDALGYARKIDKPRRGDTVAANVVIPLLFRPRNNCWVCCQQYRCQPRHKGGRGRVFETPVALTGVSKTRPRPPIHSPSRMEASRSNPATAFVRWSAVSEVATLKQGCLIPGAAAIFPATGDSGEW